MKKLLWVFIGIMGLYVFFSFRLYSSDTIEGWVIDMDTNEPLEGVKVHIEWNIHAGFITGTGFGVIQEFKTTTDKNGYFFFPAWGPISYKRGNIEEHPSLRFTKETHKEKYISSYNMYLSVSPWVSSVTIDNKWYWKGCCDGGKIALKRK